MKKNLIQVGAASLLVAGSGCDVHVSFGSTGWSDNDLKAVTNVIQTAEFPAGLKGLEVHNRFGATHITGVETGDTGWTWKFTVHARDDASAQRLAAAASCKAELEDGQLKLVATFPETKEPHSFQSDLEIRAPKAVAIHSENRFGRTEIADLAGSVDAEDDNGAVEIRNIGGDVQARTSFASLIVSHTGRATLRNRNGEIRASKIGGPLEAKTSFASLTAQDITGSASLENQNGRIEANGIGGALDAGTSFSPLTARDVVGPAHLRDRNGSVELRRVRGDADVATSFAGLRVDGIQGDATLANRNGSVSASDVTGFVKAATSFAPMEITGGGPKFLCDNRNGSIRLRATSATVTNIVAKTSFAPLQVKLPASLKPALVARTSFAQVESDFPVLMSPKAEEGLAEAAPEAPQITLHNQNGKISVVRE